MRLYLISDNSDALNGMRLAGIEGTVVHNPQELQQALQTALEAEDIAMILVTEKIADVYQEDLDNARKNGTGTLLVTIPSAGGSSAGKDRITRYLREAIGVKI
ncbi:MAG: V-type ATP synthase subunit F [Oscillospiraceae bacterium]|nr:V-type ATP synthase subunit F [Oscillospiraceae bacterium]